MNKEVFLNAVKIMLFVVVSAMGLFLICLGGGRLVIIFNFLIKPFIWVYTSPMVGPFIFIITGLVIYAILVRSPSPEWLKNERTVSLLALLIVVGGWLSSTEYAGIMFLLTCLVGVSYPIIQIVRFETRRGKFF